MQKAFKLISGPFLQQRGTVLPKSKREKGRDQRKGPEKVECEDPRKGSGGELPKIAAPTCRPTQGGVGKTEPHTAFPLPPL